MKIFLIVIFTSLAVVILMFLLNAASFDGIGKNKLSDDSLKNQKIK
jgi:hypothetical protein